MPELPEVETIRIGLKKWLIGQSITEIQVMEPRLRYMVDSKKLNQLLLGGQICKISRRSKYLIIHLHQKNCLIIHLGMTGQLLQSRNGAPLQSHDHVLFKLEKGLQLRFRDPRRFGLIDAMIEADIDTHRFFKSLGIEPLSKGCNPFYLKKISEGSRKPIKNFIMDTHRIAGIGNIYANEALYKAGIRPTKESRKISIDEWKKLTRAIKQVLKKAIQEGGTTLNDFVNSEGQEGYFQVSLQVYGKENHSCPKCQKKIRKVTLVNRSTFFCPGCQNE